MCSCPQLLLDAAAQPLLYRFQGPLPAPALQRWAQRQRGTVPSDLLHFWQNHGGGDFQDTQTILSPFGSRARGGDVDGVTRLFRRHGLARHWLVFHLGHGLSAAHLRRAEFGWFHQGVRSPTRTFTSMSDWYSALGEGF